MKDVPVREPGAPTDPSTDGMSICVCVCVCLCVFREGILGTLSYSGVLQPIRLRMCVCVFIHVSDMLAALHDSTRIMGRGKCDVWHTAL